MTHMEPEPIVGTSPVLDYSKTVAAVLSDAGSRDDRMRLQADAVARVSAENDEVVRLRTENFELRCAVKVLAAMVR